MNTEQTPKTNLQDENPVNEFDVLDSMNKVFRFIWAGLFFLCLYGIIFQGAYWHIVTAIMCAVMYAVSKDDEEAQQGENDNVR